MNYVAINALLARVYLYDNDWNNAAKYAKHVIDDFVTRRKWFYFTDPYDYAKATDKYKYVKLYEDTFLAFTTGSYWSVLIILNLLIIVY